MKVLGSRKVQGVSPGAGVHGYHVTALSRHGQ
jgi:hypothetical protein